MIECPPPLQHTNVVKGCQLEGSIDIALIRCYVDESAPPQPAMPLQNRIWTLLVELLPDCTPIIKDVGVFRLGRSRFQASMQLKSDHLFLGNAIGIPQEVLCKQISGVVLQAKVAV